MTQQIKAKRGGLNYADYLKLDRLLSAQEPQSDHPDELQFIVIHQVHELWFKLMISSLLRLRDNLGAGDLMESLRLVGQIRVIFENLTGTVQQLHSLPPGSFHQFRALLAPGSGLQSYQFREVEFICGLRDERHIAWVKSQLQKAGGWEYAERHLAHPSLNDLVEGLFKAQGFEDVAELYLDPGKAPELYALVEALAELEHRVLSWRFGHIQLVERTIGFATMGTGGTMNDYLQASLRLRLFPALWEGRNTLSKRFDLKLGQE